MGQAAIERGRTTYLGYQGDPTDEDTKLVDMGARLYIPELGRFTTEDPLAGDPMKPITMNAYAYAAADPVTKSDPTGMCTQPGDCPAHHATPKEGREEQLLDGDSSPAVTS